ncbi:unnamed protein product [Choristocarpus tenellus]
MSMIKNAYLTIYNMASALAWGSILISCVRNVIVGSSTQDLYNEVEIVLQIVQTAALMEILHSMLGLVRSPWFVTLIQVASRLVVVWGFLWTCPSTQSQIGAMLCISSWAAVEVPRYLFYAFNIYGQVPYALFWMRYSLFAILYPTGITGELLTMWAGLNCLKESTALSVELGPLTLTAYTLAIAILVTYIPGGPYMYVNMSKNRKVAFRKRSGQPSKTKKTS